MSYRFPLIWFFVAGLFLQSMPLTGIAATPPSGDASAADLAVRQQVAGKAVLILSGAQYGIPVPDALTSGILSTLKEKGVSVNDIYVENLDLVRHNNASRRALLAGMLREKLAVRNVELVIAVTQSALDFLAQEGYELAQPGVPILSTIVDTSTIKWRGQPREVQNVINRYDIAGTIRYGLDLFPRTRRLVLIAGADKQQASFYK